VSADVLQLLMHLYQSPDTPKYILFCLLGRVILKDKVKKDGFTATEPALKLRQLHQGSPGLAELQLSGNRSPSLWCGLPYSV